MLDSKRADGHEESLNGDHVPTPDHEADHLDAGWMTSGDTQVMIGWQGPKSVRHGGKWRRPMSVNG